MIDRDSATPYAPHVIASRPDEPIAAATLVRGPALVKRDGTLYPYVHSYTAGRAARREITARTVERQRMCLWTLAATYGQRPVKNMSRRDIEQWIATRSHIAHGTRRGEFSIVRGFVHWLQTEGVIKKDPMLQVKTPRVPRRVPRALNRDETAKLWEVLPDARARAIVALMLGCGLRRFEVTGLTTSDWNRYDQTLRVVGKGGHQRVVPVTPSVTRWLSEYVGGNATWAPLIRRSGDLRPVSDSYLSQLMRRWMEDAGIKTGAGDGRACHSLRHTLASEVADVESDLRVVQEMLGHSELSSTAVYLRHAGIGRVRAAMELANPGDTDDLTVGDVQRRLEHAHASAVAIGRPELAQSLLRAVLAAIERAA